MGFAGFMKSACAVAVVRPPLDTEAFTGNASSEYSVSGSSRRHYLNGKVNGGEEGVSHYSFYRLNQEKSCAKVEEDTGVFRPLDFAAGKECRWLHPHHGVRQRIDIFTDTSLGLYMQLCDVYYSLTYVKEDKAVQKAIKGMPPIWNDVSSSFG
ncbi:hypothetical protein LXL04_018165 [Taraxacum kok-saghyz]